MECVRQKELSSLRADRQMLGEAGREHRRVMNHTGNWQTHPESETNHKIKTSNFNIFPWRHAQLCCHHAKANYVRYVATVQSEQVKDYKRIVCWQETACGGKNAGGQLH